MTADDKPIVWSTIVPWDEGSFGIALRDADGEQHSYRAGTSLEAMAELRKIRKRAEAGEF